jgi:hypothetical protein
MTNHYEVAEVVEIGKAQDLILGTNKLVPVFFDGPEQDPREEMTDDE